MDNQGWTIGQWLSAYVIALLVMGALDGLWLGWLAKALYQREMGDLMAASPRLIPAGLFYVAYPLAVVFFGLMPSSRPAEAFLRCAALGLTAYATYNLTCMSIVRGFSAYLGVVDMAWGTFATGVAGTLAFSAVRGWALRSG